MGHPIHEGGSPAQPGAHAIEPWASPGQPRIPVYEGAPLKKAKPAEGTPLLSRTQRDPNTAEEPTAIAREQSQRKEIGEEGEGEKINRNRITSGRHGDRIPCPMDGSHSIYALRLQAHLKKCTKARDIAFSHCLPFMQPGANLPLKQHQQQPEPQQDPHQDQQHQHAKYVETSETAAGLTPQLEAKILEAYRRSLLYLAGPAAAAPAAATAADTETATPAPWEVMEQLPAAAFIDQCCSKPEEGKGEATEREAVLLLRAAADACEVPLGASLAAAEGPPLASFGAELGNALLMPHHQQQRQLQHLLQQLQGRLNKHQQQLLQLLAVCLSKGYLIPRTCDKTLVVELGAGKSALLYSSHISSAFTSKTFL